MSELATMAALKISNSINQHYQQQYQEQLTPPTQNPPVQFPAAPSTASPSSDTSSLHTNNQHTITTTTTTNSLNADYSPDGASDTLSQQTMSPTTATNTPTSRSSRQTSIDGANDEIPIDSYQTLSTSTSATASMHSTNSVNIQSQSLHNGGDDDEFKHTGSVLEKLSLFERLEQRQVAAMSALNATTVTNSTAISGGPRKSDEPVKPIRSFDKEPGRYCRHIAVSFSIVLVVFVVVNARALSMIYFVTAAYVFKF